MEVDEHEDAECGSEVVVRSVAITYLQMFREPAALPEKLPANVRIDRAEYATPELVRWLYCVVGGPYRWSERLGWERAVWARELSDLGSEVWLVYVDGTPAGYCQLGAEVVDSSTSCSTVVFAGRATEVEILYFGLMDWAQGRGLGRVFLSQMVSQAWRVHRRHPLPPVSRVWVHTCDLDGEFALANYRARGFEVFKTVREQGIVLREPLGSWEAMFTR